MGEVIRAVKPERTTKKEMNGGESLSETEREKGVIFINEVHGCAVLSYQLASFSPYL